MAWSNSQDHSEYRRFVIGYKAGVESSTLLSFAGTESMEYDDLIKEKGGH